MRIFILLGLLLMVFIVHPADADIYKYRDVQGVIRYTYDLAEVPEDQRPQVQTYEEAALAPEPAFEEATGNSGSDGGKAEEKAEDAPAVDEKKIEELNQKKKKLDEEFAGLMEEKYSLLKDKENLEKTLAGRDSVAVAEYDKKVEVLNRKIADYQKRRDAFQEEAEAVKKAVENPGS
jgi:chaperonin cofactor prefoldin